MLARHPFVFDGAALAAGRQLALLPARDAAFEIGGLNPALLQRARDALADFVPMHAIRHDGAAGRQVIAPAGDVVGRAARAADDQPRHRSSKACARRTSISSGAWAVPRSRIKFVGEIGKGISVHAQSPRQVECCAELGRRAV